MSRPYDMTESRQSILSHLIAGFYGLTLVGRCGIEALQNFKKVTTDPMFISLADDIASRGATTDEQYKKRMEAVLNRALMQCLDRAIKDQGLEFSEDESLQLALE